MIARLWNAPPASGSLWMKRCLLVAAVYNIAFGLWAIFLPNMAFDLVGMARPNYLELWQCIGMIVGVYGLGYGIAAFDPLRHWPIVLVGFLGKVFGPIGFVKALVTGTLPIAFGAINITNDLIWWIPFGAILAAAWKHSHEAASSMN